VEGVGLTYHNILTFNWRISENTWKSVVTEIWNEGLPIRGRNATTNIVFEAKYSFSCRQMGLRFV